MFVFWKGNYIFLCITIEQIDMQINCDAYNLHKVKWWKENLKLHNAYGENAKLQKL